MKNKNILMILLLSTFLMGCTNKDSELIQNENVQSTENATDIDKDSSTSVEDSAISDKDEEAEVSEDNEQPYKQLVESLGIEKYQYPEGFEVDKNLEKLLENMAISYKQYSSDDDLPVEEEKHFIHNFCQNSWFCYDYIFDSLSTSKGLINKQQIEYIQYSFSGQYREFQSIDDNYVVDINKCSSGFNYAELTTYELISEGEEIVIKAYFDISDNSSEEADITLIKNEYSCFDGYSVKSFSVIDDVAKGCSRASFVVDLYNDGNRVKRV